MCRKCTQTISCSTFDQFLKHVKDCTGAKDQD